MAKVRLGKQLPTQSIRLDYTDSLGQKSLDFYRETGRTEQEWQAILMTDIMAINSDGLWVHTKFGYSLPRRNGKNEVVVMRVIYEADTGNRDRYGVY